MKIWLTLLVIFPSVTYSSDSNRHANNPEIADRAEVVRRRNFQTILTMRAEVERWEREEAELVRAIVEKDKADGINAEARLKEAKLQKLSESLVKLASPEEVVSIMGTPDMTQVIHVHQEKGGKVISVLQTNTFNQISANKAFALSYWPRVGVSFDGKHGQGYRVLYLLFNEQHVLDRWFWEQPKPWYAGSLNMVQRRQEYWNGSHLISKPPPYEFSW